MRKVLAVFSTENDERKAELIEEGDTMWINFYENGNMIAAETYEGHSRRFYEDAAENFVLGIKNV